MKRVLLVALALFLVWWLVQSPNEFAGVAETAVNGAWDLVSTVASSLRQFVTALFD